MRIEVPNEIKHYSETTTKHLVIVPLDTLLEKVVGRAIFLNNPSIDVKKLKANFDQYVRTLAESTDNVNFTDTYLQASIYKYFDLPEDYSPEEFEKDVAKWVMDYSMFPKMNAMPSLIDVFVEETLEAESELHFIAECIKEIVGDMRSDLSCNNENLVFMHQFEISFDSDETCLDIEVWYIDADHITFKNIEVLNEYNLEGI